MLKKIIGGVIVLVIGGTTYSISQSSVVNNFSKNTGLTQQQSQDYINNIKQSDLKSFTKIGQDLVADGNSITNTSLKLDCINYTYPWVTSSLSCQDGKDQLNKTGNDEIALGNCYQALDTNLGNSANSKINECISDSDPISLDYSLPIVSTFIDSKTITEQKNSIAYDKSILQSALESKR